jgi:hypothetical protein
LVEQETGGGWSQKSPTVGSVPFNFIMFGGISMRNRLTTCLVILALAWAGAAVAQTGSDLTGRVIYEDAGLPGVRVLVSSPALQGQRSTVTNQQGDYIIKALPPGDYKILFELAEFTTLEFDVKMSAAQPRVLDAVMYPEAVQEEIVVTGQYEMVSTGSQGSATVEFDTLEKLPVLRTLYNASLLNAGVTSTGPSNALTISGAMGWENLFTVNGVIINDNIRNTPNQDLTIEDAILETTTITSSASAEFGRFSGGVVNVVTKSGGNQFSGSFRVNVANESWNGETPKTTFQNDTNVYVYEATLGGYIVRDALWWFLAGRDSETSASGQIFVPDGSGEQYPSGRTEERYEGRLTAAFGPNHRVAGWYLDREAVDTNYMAPFFQAADWASVDANRSLPHTAWSLNYTGVLSDNFFLEAQYSEREFLFQGSGGDDLSLVGGTPVIDYLNYPFPLMNQTWWCGVCSPESRANENYFAKASWFVSGAGTHDLVFGLDAYHDKLFSENWQSGSGYNIGTWTPQDYSTPGQPLLQMPYYGGYVIWSPVLDPSLGSDLTTNSAYINDTWRINDKLTVNLGVRYDSNDGRDQGQAKVVDDSRFSPRLSASYDVRGDGKLILVGGFSRYVVGMAQGVVDNGSSAGGVAYNTYVYTGPDILAGTPEYPTTADAVAGILDWFMNDYGGWSNTTNLWYAGIPGLSPKVPGGLRSPYGDEATIGFSYRLGTRGVIRADYVYRDYGSFYATDYSPNRQVTDDVIGLVSVDLGYIVNVDEGLKRTYHGLQTRFDYRIGSRWNIGANYTLSEVTGNTNLETAGSGPGTSSILAYPEYFENEWTRPMGPLATDQTHKFNGWVSWDAIATTHHNLNISLLHSFLSGTPYSATQTFSTVPYVGDPADLGYLGTNLAAQTYYFSDRGAFRTDNVTRTDIAINYSFFVNMLGGQLEFFIQPEVINVFNENAVTNPNTTIAGPRQGMEPFDPFTETPVEGVNWEFGPNWGEAQVAGDYQQPRTLRFSFGLRF